VLEALKAFNTKQLGQGCEDQSIGELTCPAIKVHVFINSSKHHRQRRNYLTAIAAAHLYQLSCLRGDGIGE
jgi:hypothetical protein